MDKIPDKIPDYTNKLPNMVSDYTNCISDNVSLRLSNGK